MRPARNIEELVKRLHITPRAQAHDKTLRDILEAQEKATKKGGLVKTRGNKVVRIIAGAAAAAAAVIFVSVLFRGSVPEHMGQVTSIYGIVALKNGNTDRDIRGSAELRRGQWVETLSGSKAQVLLKDKSRLHAAPRTQFMVDESEGGHRVLLGKGYVRIEAAKQPAGKALTITSAGSEIRVLGTELDVRAITRPDGSRRTRVSVSSGSVEVESGGKKVVLLANTEGIIDEGKAPLRRSLTEEVNEMTRLFELSRHLAEEAGLKVGLPAIIEPTGSEASTVWTIIPAERIRRQSGELYVLNLKGASEARVFTSEGAEVPTSERGDGDKLWLDIEGFGLNSDDIDYLILKLSAVGGLFEYEENGTTRFDMPSSGEGILTLLQFRLPEFANIEEVSGRTIEIKRKWNKLRITVAADSQMPEFCD